MLQLSYFNLASEIEITDRYCAAASVFSMVARPLAQPAGATCSPRQQALRLPLFSVLAACPEGNKRLDRL